jgi:hypothetical protein
VTDGGIASVREAKVRTKNIYALLPLGDPFIGKRGHGIHARKAYRRLIGAQLSSGGSESFGKETYLVPSAGCIYF